MSDACIHHCYENLWILLNDQAPKIRCCAIAILCKLAAAKHTEYFESPIHVICKFLEDPESSVKAEVLRQLSSLWSLYQGTKLPDIDYINSRVQLLHGDSDPGVRYAALCFIWIVGQCRLNNGVSQAAESDRTTFHDGVFISCCEAVNDASSDIRAQALQLMGTMQNSTTYVLLQTLSKEIFDMRELRSNRDMKTKSHLKRLEAGDFDISGDISLLKSSMCGAFIHGLEDEFSVVRSCAIDAICELACCSKEFTDSCVPFLIDMFNDESISIRVNAITSLAKMSETWNLNIKDELIEAIFLAVFDGESEVRSSTLKLIGYFSACNFFSHSS